MNAATRIFVLTGALLAGMSLSTGAIAHTDAGAHLHAPKGTHAQGYTAGVRPRVTHKRICHRHRGRYHCHIVRVYREHPVSVQPAPIQRGPSAIGGPSTVIRLQFNS